MSTVPPIKCPTHKDYFITNMCILKQCTEPLCPECIPRHIKDHAANGQIPQIENIQNVRQEQKAMVFDIVQKLNEQLFLLSSTDEMVIMNNLFMKLEQTKQEIIKSLNKRFDDYKQQLQQRFREVTANKDGNGKESIDLVKMQLSRMDNLLNKFESHDYIQAILETFFNDIGPQIYQNLDQRCQEYQSKFPDLSIDINVQNLILQDLDQYIQICNRNQKQRIVSLREQEIVQQLTGEKPMQVYSQQQQQSQIKKENMSEINLNKDSKQLLTNNVYTKSYQSSQNQNIAREYPSSQSSFKPQFVHNTSELVKVMQDDQVRQLKIISQQQQSSLIQNSEDILVSCYADQRKILIYRMQKFNQPLKNLNVSDFQEVGLILDRRIAVGHQCIIYGKEILIIGGIERDVDRNLSIQSVYKVNLIQKTLNLHSNMIHRRQGFGACLVDTCIYVCCGSSTDCEDSSINTLERFDGQRWTPLRSCMHACTGCSLGNINNEYLIKIGGIDKQFINIQTIEVYSIKQNTWFDLQIFDSQGNLWNEIPLHSGISQINQTELMVFGGQIGEDFTDKSYIITLDITTSNIRSAIVRRGFQVPTIGYVDQVKLYENSVYAIMTEGVHLAGTKKTVINCNSDKWIYINNINDCKWTISEKYNAPQNIDYKRTIVDICSFSTVEELGFLMKKNILSEPLKCKMYVHYPNMIRFKQFNDDNADAQIEAIQFFKNDIKPWWEDENNKNGGEIQFDISTQHYAVYDQVYQDILLQILGQSTEELRHINGLRVLDKINAKQGNRIRIELWMDIDPKDQDESIGKLIDWIDTILKKHKIEIDQNQFNKVSHKK